jgi:hypothetical protein
MAHAKHKALVNVENWSTWPHALFDCPSADLELHATAVRLSAQWLQRASAENLQETDNLQGYIGQRAVYEMHTACLCEAICSRQTSGPDQS